MVVLKSRPCSSLFNKSCAVFTYQRVPSRWRKSFAEVPALGVRGIGLRAPEDVDEQRVEVPLVAVRQVAPERELLGGIGLVRLYPKSSAESNRDQKLRSKGCTIDTSGSRTSASPTTTAAFFCASACSVPETRLPSNVSSRNWRSLSIDAIFSHLILKSESE